MNVMTARFFRITSIALFAIAVAPRSAHAQLTVTITLNVPVQVQDIDPRTAAIRVHCNAQPVGAASVSFGHQDFGDAGPVVNGAYTGTAHVVLTGTTAQAVTPGQQWSYQCHSELLLKTMDKSGNVTGTPGITDWAALAPSSGPNLVQGTFTTQ
ncbi:MAG: hypothetical protein M3Y30_00785 [Gemmatimonadota bacterium]|nr:hypothetical protein [Gemmatimonadota bacterium]